MSSIFLSWGWNQGSRAFIAPPSIYCSQWMVFDLIFIYFIVCPYSLVPAPPSTATQSAADSGGTSGTTDRREERRGEKLSLPHRIDEGEMAKCSHGQSTWRRGHYSKHSKAKHQYNRHALFLSWKLKLFMFFCSFLLRQSCWPWASTSTSRAASRFVSNTYAVVGGNNNNVPALLYDNCSGKSCSTTIYSC